MARPKEPADLIAAKGKSHLGKAEMEARRAAEVPVTTEEIEPPEYLTPNQKKHFNKLARQLQRVKILSDTDIETLARYVSAQELYVDATKKARAALKKSDDLDELERLTKLQDRYCKQAANLARDLGLTILSRAKIQVPVKEEEQKKNRFAQFEESDND